MAGAFPGGPTAHLEDAVDLLARLFVLLGQRRRLLPHLTCVGVFRVNCGCYGWFVGAMGELCYG